MISSVRNCSVRILDANLCMIMLFQILDIKSNYLPGIVQNARNRPSPYPIWGIRSSLGASSLPRPFIFYPDCGWMGSSPALAKVELSALFRLSFLPPSPLFFLLFGLRSRTPASRCLQTIFQLRTIF
jgi:hypothetical protein